MPAMADGTEAEKPKQCRSAFRRDNRISEWRSHLKALLQKIGIAVASRSARLFQLLRQHQQFGFTTSQTAVFHHLFQFDALAHQAGGMTVVVARRLV